MVVMVLVGIAVAWAIAQWQLKKRWKRNLSSVKQAIAQAHQQDLSQALAAQQTAHEADQHAVMEQLAQAQQQLQQLQQLQQQQLQQQQQATQRDRMVSTHEQQLQAQQHTIQALSDENTALQQQLNTERTDHKRAAEEWRQRIEQEQRDGDALLQEAAHESIQKDNAIQELTESNQALSRQIAELEATLVRLKYAPGSRPSAHEAEAEAGLSPASVNPQDQILEQIMNGIRDEDVAPSLAEVLTVALPTLQFLRDSVKTMADVYINQQSQFDSLITTLVQIREGDYQSLRQYQKINATNGAWSECRVPHISMLRLYFQKCAQEDALQVWVSRKQDKKTQKRDFEWLSHQTAC